MRLDDKVDVVSRVLQGSVLGPLLYILCTLYLFPIFINQIVGYVDDTTIHAVIPRPLSRPQVMESLNQDMAKIYFWCLKWHTRLNPMKTKSMVVSRSRIYAPGYGDLTISGAELEEVTSLRILGLTFDSKLTFKTHLREAVSKATKSLGVVLRAGKLFACPPVLKNGFDAYGLSNKTYASR